MHLTAGGAAEEGAEAPGGARGQPALHCRALLLRRGARLGERPPRGGRGGDARVADEEHVNKIYQLEKRIRELERALSQWARREEELVARETKVALAEAMERQIEVFTAQVRALQ